MPKLTIARLRSMNRTQMIVVCVYSWILLGGLIWYTAAAIHLGGKATVLHALTFIGAARLADLILIPVIKRATIRRINRVTREMRLLRDEHRKDPVADHKLTRPIEQLDRLVEIAKHL